MVPEEVTVICGLYIHTKIVNLERHIGPFTELLRFIKANCVKLVEG